MCGYIYIYAYIIIYIYTIDIVFLEDVVAWIDESLAISRC